MNTHADIRFLQNHREILIEQKLPWLVKHALKSIVGPLYLSSHVTFNLRGQLSISLTLQGDPKPFELKEIENLLIQIGTAVGIEITYLIEIERIEIERKSI